MGLRHHRQNPVAYPWRKAQRELDSHRGQNIISLLATAVKAYTWKITFGFFRHRETANRLDLFSNPRFIFVFLLLWENLWP